MGDVSIIARRLSPVYVQHGWSGNGGYFNDVGLRLLSWYDDPGLMDYLFGLGQLSLIGKPGSEKGGERMILTHQTTGEPHWVDPSERWIFSKIAFIDYGYFYDSDNTWYYVIPGPFRVKIPLAYIANHLDDQEFEFEECKRIISRTMDYCLNEFVPTDNELIEIANSYDKPYTEIVNQILGADHPDHELFDHYRKLYKAMDDWVVVKTDDANENITKIILMKNQGENRKETIDWE